MKRLLSKVAPAAIVALTVATFAPEAEARPSQGDQCAIWICLPTAFGFPECDKAFDAMIWRVTRFKPPVPNFLGCVDGPDANQTRMSSSYTTSHYPNCAEGHYSRIDRRRGKDRKICTNPSTGSSYSIRESDDTFYNVTMNVDGQTYSYSFNADNPRTRTPSVPTTPTPRPPIDDDPRDPSRPELQIR